MQKKTVFFPNLDGLRFICFLMVFLFHCYKTVFANVPDGFMLRAVNILFRNGELGVNFFFVLSGFLITYLLIQEKEYTSDIHVPNFYVRRILRIWPLFYLCVLIGFGLWPLLKSFAGVSPAETSNPVFYLLLINNFDYIHQQSVSDQLFPDALILIVLWSVAVEEQFYLSWPLLLKISPRKLYPLIFTGIILGTLLFRYFYAFSYHTDLHSRAVIKFHTLSVIGDMAVGALMAYFTASETKFLRFIRQMPRVGIFLLYFLVSVVFLFREEIFFSGPMIVVERLIIALLFGMVIMEQNFSENSFYKFSRFKKMSKLGNYTYGLYCYHFLVISLVNFAFIKLAGETRNFGIAVFCSLISLFCVILISKISYRYFETPFLKLKNRFAFIVK